MGNTVIITIIITIIIIIITLVLRQSSALPTLSYPTISGFRPVSQSETVVLE